MTFYTSNHVKNLPDAYKKTTDSNNFKILEVERSALAAFRSDVSDVFNSLDIDKAYGATLDLYGTLAGQLRNGLSDAEYRIMIKAKNQENVSTGTYNSVVEAICNTFSCSPTDTYFRESSMPLSLEIVQMPYAAITKNNLTPQQAIAVIRRFLPVCVIVENYSFIGSFQFSASETEYDEFSGFSEAENGAIGGFFGMDGNVIL